MGIFPAAWQPLTTPTSDEMTFLTPLDIVSARERVLLLFDFEYEWEVYKPESQRRWGYYTLPILYQDRLVTRTDLMLERTTSMPVLKGFRLESYAVTDNQLITALANGFKRFMRLIEAQALEALFSASQHFGMGYGNCFLYLNRYHLPTREGGSLSDAYRADFRHSRQLFCPGRRPG